MRINLPRRPGGYIVIEEVLKDEPAATGRIRVTTSQWLCFLAKAKDGSLDCTAAVTDAMVERVISYLENAARNNPPVVDQRGLIEGMLEAAYGMQRPEPEGAYIVREVKAINSY